MSENDSELEKIRKRKLQMYIQQKNHPNEIIHLHTPNDYYNLTKKYPQKIIVLDFWAEWCGPCKMFAPVFEQLQKDYKNDFIFAKLNVDNNPQIAQNLRITGIPTTVFIKEGRVIQKAVGMMDYNRMKQYLEKLKS